MTLTREWILALILLGHQNGIPQSTSASALGITYPSLCDIISRKEVRPNARLRVDKTQPCSNQACDRTRLFLTGFCNKCHMAFYYRMRPKLKARSPSISPLYNNIMDLRDLRRWNMKTLCHETGVGRNVYIRLARAQDISLETLRGIGAAFNIDYWRLLIPGEFTPKPEL